MPPIPIPKDFFRCPYCSIYKHVSEFYANRASPSGRSTYCKDCSKLYLRRNKLPPDQIPESKKCRTCHEVKPLSEFFKNITKPDGVDLHCKFCKTRSHANAYFKYNYGITNVEYKALLTSQNGRCAICGETETTVRPTQISGDYRLCVDHDHNNGKVRGLLCNDCNILVGHLERSEGRVLESALEYIRRHKSTA